MQRDDHRRAIDVASIASTRSRARQPAGDRPATSIAERSTELS